MSLKDKVGSRYGSYKGQCGENESLAIGASIDSRHGVDRLGGEHGAALNVYVRASVSVAVFAW
jgi:hypothetical protein